MSCPDCQSTPCANGCITTTTTLAPIPPSCDGNECVELYYGNCVQYTGPDVQCLGITTGMSMNTIVQTLAAAICLCPSLTTTTTTTTQAP